jgi:hypothetical protein
VTTISCVGLLDDLSEIGIERRSYNAMVTLDVRRRWRPSRSASARSRRTRSGALVGYLIVSRYVDAGA